MMKDRKLEMIAVLLAIDEGWFLVDQKDEDDFMIFSNESRDERTDFYPKKELIIEMQRCGYLYPIEPLKRPLFTYRTKEQSDGEWMEVSQPASIPYTFSIAPMGDQLLNDWVKPRQMEKRRIGFLP